MYTNIKSIQYLIAALKANKVEHVVISPGNSHNAIVRSMEEDGSFRTYNIVDERSAAFFACGLAQELKTPIAICCTAGTAAINYMSGVTEAHRRGLPLVVITGDKDRYVINQNEDQVIDQVDIFKTITRYSCVLPMIKDKNDEWYCQRILNEAFLEINHHGKGPVHIDVPIGKGMLAIGNDFTTPELPEFRTIKRFNLCCDDQNWAELFGSLDGKRLFIICGQDDHIPQREVELIESICRRYNCVFGIDKLSNLHCRGTVDISRASKRMERKINSLWPDVIISLAGNSAMQYKTNLKGEKNADYWIVNEEGRVADPFHKLTVVIEGTTVQFLERMNDYGNDSASNEYYTSWRAAADDFHLPEFPFSNMYALSSLMKNMPSGSNFNIGNSTTIRLANYFDLDDSIQCYCNRGVNGIDGCCSTFIGQAAAATDTLNFLVIGDLTFFYDMNSIWNRYVGKNVRIMLSNNEGAALFHFNQGASQYPTLNENVAAEHFANAKGWVESQGFRYLSASNKEEFDNNLPDFLSPDSDKPIFFEVFTHKDEDARLQHEFFDSIVLVDAAVKAKDGAKKIIKTVLGEDMLKKIKEIF